MTARSISGQITQPNSAGASGTGGTVGDQLRGELQSMNPDQRAGALADGRQLFLAASPCGAWSPGPGFSCVQGRNHQGKDGWFWTVS